MSSNDSAPSGSGPNSNNTADSRPPPSGGRNRLNQLGSVVSALRSMRVSQAGGEDAGPPDGDASG